MTEDKDSRKPKKISDIPDELRPREKALADGIRSLTDAELMAIIFSTGIKGKNIIDLCQEILDDNGQHISLVAKMNVREITERYRGIGPAKALTMLAALELGRRSGADSLLVEQVKITDSESAYRFMKPKLEGLPHEEFWILLLRQNCAPIRCVKVGQGGLTGTMVDVKVVLREALLASSPRIMLFHNHPSGNMNPSPQDIALTRKIAEAAGIVDISVLDHIIVGDGSYYSFHDQGNIL